jgi:surface antigen
MVRLVTHAVVLVVAVVVASYSSVSHGLPGGLLRLGVANAAARSMEQGGTISGDVTLGRAGVVVQQIANPTQMPVRRTPITYSVGDHDDLRGIATRFNLTVDEIRWSNPGLGASAKVKTGDTLVIPPITGVVITVRGGDTADSLAAAWHVDPLSILDFNGLHKTNDVKPGMQLVLPAARGPRLSPLPSAPNLPASIGSGGTFAIKVGGSIGSLPVSRFPWGQCTYYVATRVPVPWNGNAWQWYGNAQAMGYAVGATPRPGAIMVTWENRYFGHVAYVESVNADGSWVVSEMNYVGLGVIDQRTIRSGQQTALIGFVYP